VFEQELLLRYLQYLPAFAIGVLGWRLRLGNSLFAFAGRWPLARADPAPDRPFPARSAGAPALRARRDPSPLLRVLDGAWGALAYAMALIVFRLLAHLRQAQPGVSFLVDGAMTIYLFHMIVAMLVILAMAHLGGATGRSHCWSGRAWRGGRGGGPASWWCGACRFWRWCLAQRLPRASSRAEWVAIRARTAKGPFRAIAGNGRKPEGPRNPADKPAIG
jgi:hypothetical protein